jgi:hypothetical protein
MPSATQLILRGFLCTAAGTVLGCLVWFVLSFDRGILIPFTIVGAVVGSGAGWLWTMGGISPQPTNGHAPGEGAERHSGAD